MAEWEDIEIYLSPLLLLYETEMDRESKRQGCVASVRNTGNLKFSL